jgi:Domain of unknown function (DUF4372)/Transposase DDE domain
VRAFSSVFSQILNLFSRAEFQQQVRHHRAERHARGLSSWTQFVAMLFCQLGRAQSLREICHGLASTEGKLSHLGIAAPARSSVAYANAHRPWQLYQSVFYALLERCREVAPRHRFRFKNKLLSMDATTIDLCAASFDWAKFRRTKGGVKLHLLLDHDGCLPQFAVITDAKTFDINVVRFLDFPAASILVFDRAYNDFQWFDDLTARGIFFVTRMKDRTRYEVLHSRSVAAGGNILLDQDIVLVKEFAGIDPIELRRIEMVDPDGGENLVFLSNHRRLAATTLAAIYKDRWKIETFFRTIKQNLRIKTFVGTSSNALHTQLWTALIAILILRYLQLKSSFHWSMSNLVALLRFNLFAYRDLWNWINKPFDLPPLSPPTQLTLTQFGQQA